MSAGPWRMIVISVNGWHCGLCAESYLAEGKAAAMEATIEHLEEHITSLLGGLWASQVGRK